MRLLKKLAWAVLALVFTLLLAWVIISNVLRPDYDGERQLANLTEEVTVHYDAYGIPHIYGSNNKDVFRALGYVHAQDRLWQMELLRRIGKGGLSEVFGKDLLDTDRFFLSLGIDDSSLATVAKLDLNSESVQLSQAYLDGINQFIEDGPKPVEFYLTGIATQPFELKDIYNIMGYMAFSFAQAHKTDPLLTAIKDKLGPEYLEDLEIDVDPNTTWIKNNKELKPSGLQETMTTSVMESLKKLSIPLFEGSNSWVIAPAKTKKGKVIFANDPHIGFAQPSVWYEAHVVTPTYEKYGYHLAGVPFPILGHDRNLAYGMTMFENDDVDFYFEEQHPTDSTKYRFGEVWNTYETVSRTIKVKDVGDVNFNYKKTVHGPVMNNIADQITGERPISMSWIYTAHENKVMEALYGISKARNRLEFQASLPFIHAPGLNIMYGDAEGNVAWWATAKLYQIPDTVHTKFIFEPNTGFTENRAYLDFSENPQAINPPWNYVYSANNQPDSIAGMLYPGYYLPENRAKRIVELLEPKNDWEAIDVQKMMTDVTSSVNPDIVKSFGKSLDIKKLTDNQLQLLDRLNNWKGDYPLESVEATIFHRWSYFFLENTFSDELGHDMFRQFLTTHFQKRLIAPMAAKPNSVWWDDIKTDSIVETHAMIVQKSFNDAFESLEKVLGEDTSKWTWGKVHTVEHGHPIGQLGGLVRRFFNVGPFPVNGSTEVINNMSFGYMEGGYNEVDLGPSTRRVVDFSDIENSMSILPTGQSGNPFSEHYRDQAEMFVKGEFRKMMMNKEEIESTSKSILFLKP